MRRTWLGGLAESALLLAPGVALALLALDDGGFFPDATGLTAIAVVAALCLRAMLARRLFSVGIGPGFAVGAAAFTAFAAWTLASSGWSHAPARAILEYNRVLLYLGVFVLFGLLGRSGARARLLVGGLALAAALLCVASLCVWLLPKSFPVDPSDFERDRLSWPTSYWNANGLLAGLGTVFALHLTCSLRESPWVRAAAAGAVPLTAAVLWFTASRGAAAATVLAICVYLVAGASRGLLTGVPAAAFGIVAALIVARGVEGISTLPASAEALSDGRHAATSLAVIALLATAVRLALTGVDRRVATMSLPRPRPGGTAIAAGTVVIGLAVGFLALDGPGRAERAYDEFVHGDPVGNAVPPAQRFTVLSGNDRTAQWKIALHGLRDHPLRGTGAGTYVLAWQRERPSSFDIIDAHSLYAEQAGELGVVGIALLIAVLAAIVAGLGARLRGPSRTAWAALLAATVGWLAHAGVDWDWEMPALSLWVFAAGGLALSGHVRARSMGRSTPLIVRIATAAGCVVLALTPIAVVRSQRDLTQSLGALRARDCPGAVDAALASTQAMASRPEPLELLSYCNVRSGRNKLGLRTIAAAVRRDPGNWEFHYAQALVRAAAGIDPRSAAQAALARNPRNRYAQDAVRRFRPSNRKRWRRLALAAPVNIAPD